MHELEEILGYQFRNPRLLEEALTHPSMSRQHNEGDPLFNYERLEFLGDAVLGLVIAELLIRKYPKEKEGALAKRQAGLVRGEAVASVAIKLEIGRFIIMTHGEESTGGRENISNIENALEAIIGAIYRDSSIENAAAFICKHWVSLVENMKEPPKDPKTSLQEWAQAKGLPIPEYTVIRTTGPSHNPRFTVTVAVEGHDAVQAEGASKKKAEKSAARKLLDVVLELTA